MSVKIRVFTLVCFLLGFVTVTFGNGIISSGDMYPGRLGETALSESVVTLGVGRSAEVDGWDRLLVRVGSVCGKIARFKGKIPVDLNPARMFLGVNADRKVSCTISGMA